MSIVMWIGLGNMGLPMAKQLIEAGHEVRGIEINEVAAREAADSGIVMHSSWQEAVSGVDAVVTMLPTGKHVSNILAGDEGIFSRLQPGTIVVDSSTIDTGTAETLHTEASSAGVHFVDAPVSGGVVGAASGALTFMVGGTSEAFAAAALFIDPMAAKIVHTGSGGTGQAAKIVNNMIFGVCLAATCEGVLLGERLGLDPAVFYQIATTSSSDNFPLRNWYPAPGVVDNAPSTNDYQPGFTGSLLLKDLTLAVAAAESTGTQVDAAQAAQNLFSKLVDDGGGALDCTALFPALAGRLEQLQPGHATVNS